MSLMLDALKRIEAKQTPAPSRLPEDPVETVVSPAVTEPPALSIDALPSMLPEDFVPSQPVSLEAAMDQLQALVCEAGLLYDAEPELEAAGAGRIDNPSYDLSDEVEAPPVTPIAADPDPYSATAEQILRQLPGDRSQVLLFTSPADGQGKTMTLARLAPLLARGLEGGVLVVDADFRNPDMARWLAVAPTWCLPDVLTGAAEWAAAVQTTAHAGVSLLPGGTDTQSRGPGRSVQCLSHLLRDLASHYGLVVVDAPSLAHRGTVQLAAACDATYLVVRLGAGSPRMLREAAQVVERNGARLLGCVVIDGK